MTEILPIEQTNPEIANYLLACIKTGTKLHIDSNTIYINKGFGFQQWAIEEKQERNDPCNCGSGKKYKKCCGR